MGEYVEDINGLALLQDDGQFKLGLDAVLLARFSAPRAGMRVCELGCGAGALILLLLSVQRELLIDGVEIQPAAAQLALRSVKRNGLEDRVRIIQGDFLRELAGLTPGKYDMVTANPPYMPANAGKHARLSALSQARMEISCTLTDVCAAASRLLRPGGLFEVVYPPARLAELMRALPAYGLSPRRMRMVHPRTDRPASLVLLEARRGGRGGLTVEKPFITGNEHENRADDTGAGQAVRAPGLEEE